MSVAGGEIWWGLTSVALATVQYIPYVHGILNGKFKPHIFTWLIWAIPGGVVAVAQAVKGAGAGAWASGYTALLCMGVFLLSLSRGDKKIAAFDWVALFLAGLAIVLWMMVRDPLIAVILTSTSCVLGWLPTIRKSFDSPDSEGLIAWSLAGAKWITSLLAVQTVSWTTALFPATSAVMTLSFVILVVVRRTQLNRAI